MSIAECEVGAKALMRALSAARRFADKKEPFDQVRLRIDPEAERLECIAGAVSRAFVTPVDVEWMRPMVESVSFELSLGNVDLVLLKVKNLIRDLKEQNVEELIGIAVEESLVRFTDNSGIFDGMAPLEVDRCEPCLPNTDIHSRALAVATPDTKGRMLLPQQLKALGAAVGTWNGELMFAVAEEQAGRSTTAAVLGEDFSAVFALPAVIPLAEGEEVTAEDQMSLYGDDRVDEGDERGQLVEASRDDGPGLRRVDAAPPKGLA
ncbi:hypothetical protein [Corynebacterium sp. TAE3-ERU2]|uniref:hypothetical protein n=1 Tax=Corynebacterium sp. TAE3-ERU2 TaxID=2849497 RepID=UPI001C494CEA|nr:hypothetical protein [Corynebacterium sp. TAE3-ERU2]MBV7302922.1 hypothetical protein [Corynebacterium sp. TAE3-ERU2]